MAQFSVGPHNPLVKINIKRTIVWNNFQINIVSSLNGQALMSCSFNGPETKKKLMGGDSFLDL